MYICSRKRPPKEEKKCSGPLLACVYISLPCKWIRLSHLLIFVGRRDGHEILHVHPLEQGRFSRVFRKSAQNQLFKKKSRTIIMATLFSPNLHKRGDGHGRLLVHSLEQGRYAQEFSKSATFLLKKSREIIMFKAPQHHTVYHAKDKKMTQEIDKLKKLNPHQSSLLTRALFSTKNVFH